MKGWQGARDKRKTRLTDDALVLAREKVEVEVTGANYRVSHGVPLSEVMPLGSPQELPLLAVLPTVPNGIHLRLCAAIHQSAPRKGSQRPKSPTRTFMPRDPARFRRPRNKLKPHVQEATINVEDGGNDFRDREIVRDPLLVCEPIHHHQQSFRRPSPCRDEKRNP